MEILIMERLVTYFTGVATGIVAYWMIKQGGDKKCGK